VHSGLPPGVSVVKEYRNGKTLVLCHSHRLRMYTNKFFKTSGYTCMNCGMSTSNVWPDPSKWPDVKMLVRIVMPKGIDRQQETLL
jgi:hypothetical protein